VGVTRAFSFSGREEADHPTSTRRNSMLQTSLTHKAQPVSVLASLRQEWQEAANGQSLLDVEGNVALMLADLVNSFGLSVHEQAQVLGSELFNEVQEMLAVQK